MKVKWMMLSAVAALCLVPLVGAAPAQERAAPAPRQSDEGPADPADDLEALKDLDGMDLLMAAEMDDGPGHGPGPGMGHGGMRGHGMRRGMGGKAAHELHAKLNLTDEQKSKLEDIHDRQARAAIPIQGDLRVAALDLRKLMRAERPNRQAIEAQIDRLAALRARLQKSHVASMLEARAVLTTAQQKLMREHHGGPMGHGMRGMHGMRMRSWE
jgi:Spy/CpxP family protein refolding chaperone